MVEVGYSIFSRLIVYNWIFYKKNLTSKIRILLETGEL